MTTTWNLTREQIGKKALQKVGNLARGQTANADDLALAIQALDGILKELPIFGYAWPQTALTQAALTLLAGVPTVTFPTDYYGGALVTYLDASGNELPLQLITLDQWLAIPQKSQAAAYPLMAYLDRASVLHVWPVQTANVSAKLSYQQIVADSAAMAITALDPSMMLGIVYAVAAEIGDEFGATEDQIARWRAEWIGRRSLSIMGRTFPSPDRITTAD
jgi:hypothetical protein